MSYVLNEKLKITENRVNRHCLNVMQFILPFVLQEYITFYKSLTAEALVRCQAVSQFWQSHCIIRTNE